MRPIRLLPGMLTVGGWTLASRVTGFVRDVLIAGLIGPGMLMDAFVAAFRLPNMFRRIFAEGALNAAFVPMISKRLEAGEDAEGFASLAFSGLALAALALSAIAMILMPALVLATAWGFGADGRLDLAVGYGRIVFPYILFISLAALASGALNAAGRFAAAAAAPVLLNVMLATAMAAAWLVGGSAILALVWTVPFAGAAQLGLVWIAAERAGLRIRPVRPRWTGDMSRLVRLAIPAALAGGVVQINLVVGQLVASQHEKAVSWLYSADRLYQLPLGVVGIAVGVVLLPDLSARLKAGDADGARQAGSRAAEIALALTIPCAAALLVIGGPIVSVLFERGAFGARDTAATALAVAVYGLGLPAFVLQKVQQPLFFAREDTRTPLRCALAAMVVNAAAAVGLSGTVGWIAPAFATTLAAWVMAWLLARGARGMGEAGRFDARFRRRLWRVCAATVAMAAALLILRQPLEPALEEAGWRWLALLALVCSGAAAYFAAGHALGAFRLSEFRDALRRPGADGHGTDAS